MAEYVSICAPVVDVTLAYALVQRGVQMKNQPWRFTRGADEALGFYVYALIDPRDSKVFYVGRGRGDAVRPSDRLFNHFQEALDAEEARVPWSAKRRRISEIWADGLDVRWIVVRRALASEQEASHVEAATIEALKLSQNGATLNAVRGAHVDVHGALDQDGVSGLGALPINPTEPCRVAVFNVANALAEGRDPYDATRRAWDRPANMQILQVDYAVGLSRGISRGVFSGLNWHADELLPGRLRFEANQHDEHPLLYRNWTNITEAQGWWRFGNYLIVEFDGQGSFCFIRPDAAAMRPCVPA